MRQHFEIGAGKQHKASGMARLLQLMIGACLCFYVTTIDYCDKKMCPKDKRPHLACKHSGDFDEKNCGSDRSLIVLTQSMIKFILREHNMMRNQVAKGDFHQLPACVRMLTLRWDEEFAWLAKLSVMSCKLQHHKCFTTRAFWFPGQNQAYNKFLKHVQDQDKFKILRSQVKAWNDEYRYTDAQGIASGISPGTQEIGHFLQVVRGYAQTIGCAIARYNIQGYTHQLIKCFYSCSIEEFPAYLVGPEGGRDCKSGLNQAYMNLCSEAEELDYTDPECSCCNRTFASKGTKKPEKGKNAAQRILDWMEEQVGTTAGLTYQQIMQENERK